MTPANVKCEAVLPNNPAPVSSHWFLNRFTCLVGGCAHLLIILNRLSKISRVYKPINLSLVSPRQINFCEVCCYRSYKSIRFEMRCRSPSSALCSLIVFICPEVEHSWGQCAEWAWTLKQTAFFFVIVCGRKNRKRPVYLIILNGHDSLIQWKKILIHE